MAVEKTVVPESRVSCGVPADSVSAAELDAARKTRDSLVRSCRLPPASVLTRSPEKTVAPGEAAVSLRWARSAATMVPSALTGALH